MAVLDDVRRLSQMDSIFLGQGSGQTSLAGGSHGYTVWYKGRLQQANDGGWIFRSISSDGTVVGFQLGPVDTFWSSNEAPGTGIVVQILTTTILPAPPAQGGAFPFTVLVLLQQQLPQELI